jgi:hypothetical protein
MIPVLRAGRDPGILNFATDPWPWPAAGLSLAEGFYVLRDLVPTGVTLNRCEVGPDVGGKLNLNEIPTRISSRKQFLSRYTA